MKKRVISLLLAICLSVALLPTAAFAESNSTLDRLYGEFQDEIKVNDEMLYNMDVIYHYLTEDLKLSTAAACGVMANIYRESKFLPDCSSASSSTVGLVQWYGSNCTAEKNWCYTNGYDPQSMEGQLAYLTYQLNNQSPHTSTYQYLLSVGNSSDGAYCAGYYWCYYFEIPSNRDSVSNTSGELAQRFYAFYVKVLAAGGPLVGGTGESVKIDEPEEESALPFEDVEVEDWFYEHVLYAYENKLFTGTSDTCFEPDQVMTRAQLVQVLYAMAGHPAVEYTAEFKDVGQGDWYASAVLWAEANGVVSGTGDGYFSPNTPVTREQTAVMLYAYYTRYLGRTANDLADIDTFPDADQVTYGEVALFWAVGNGLITGTVVNEVTLLAPTDSCTRAQGCTILGRFLQTMAQ